MTVFQLIAEGCDAITGNSRRRIYNTAVHTDYAFAESRIGRFLSVVECLIESPKIEIIKLIVIDDIILPKTYTPSVESSKPKQRNEVTYGIGYEDIDNSFGMSKGPTPRIMEFLEVVPYVEPDSKPCIIRFNLDGTDEVLYRWDKNKLAWELQICQI